MTLQRRHYDPGMPSSERTRAALAQALMDELQTTALNRVTVRRLTQLTGTSRQGFYYHFTDVYDLAVWTFKTEITERVMAHASYAQWSAGLTTLLEWMDEHHDQTYQTIEALSLGELERFLFTELRAMMRAVVADVEEVDGVPAPAPTEREIVVEHFTLAVLGHILHWLATDMAAEPAELARRIEWLLRGGVARSLIRAADDADPLLLGRAARGHG